MHAEVVGLDGAPFNVLLMVVAAEVTGVCHSGHQKQLAVKVAEGGGLLGELDGMLEVGGAGGGGGGVILQHPPTSTFRCRKSLGGREDAAKAAKLQEEQRKRGKHAQPIYIVNKYAKNKR